MSVHLTNSVDPATERPCVLARFCPTAKDAINRFRREIKVRLEELHAVLLQKERAISKIPVKAVDDLLFNLLRLDGEDEWCSKSNVRLVRGNDPPPPPPNIPLFRDVLR